MPASKSSNSSARKSCSRPPLAPPASLWPACPRKPKSRVATRSASPPSLVGCIFSIRKRNCRFWGEVPASRHLRMPARFASVAVSATLPIRASSMSDWPADRLQRLAMIRARRIQNPLTPLTPFFVVVTIKNVVKRGGVFTDDDRIRHGSPGECPKLLAWRDRLPHSHLPDRVCLAPDPVRTEISCARDLPRRSDYPVRIGFDGYPERDFLVGVFAFVCGQSRFDPEGRAALRARRRPLVVVVRNAGGRCKTSDGFDFGLRGSGNRVHDPAVRDRGAVDRAGLEEMMRRTNGVN